MWENIAVHALLRNEEGNHLKVCIITTYHITTKLKRLVPGRKVVSPPRKGRGLALQNLWSLRTTLTRQKGNGKVIPPKVSKTLFRLSICGICNFTSFVTCLFVSGLQGRFLMCGFLQNPSKSFKLFCRFYLYFVYPLFSFSFEIQKHLRVNVNFAPAIWSKRRNSSAAREAAISPGHAEGWAAHRSVGSVFFGVTSVLWSVFL